MSEAVGIPNNGDMTIRGKIHLIGPDTMAVDMEITAPNLLTDVRKTRRIYERTRDRRAEIEEGVCRQGDFHEETDEWGNAIYVPTTTSGDGNLLPPEQECRHAQDDLRSDLCRLADRLPRSRRITASRCSIRAGR